jgi:hypothetical protein
VVIGDQEAVEFVERSPRDTDRRKLMFTCALCLDSSKPGERMTRVVTDTRRKEYLGDAGEVIGVGFEIVKEIAVASCCKERSK